MQVPQSFVRFEQSKETTQASSQCRNECLSCHKTMVSFEQNRTEGAPPRKSAGVREGLTGKGIVPRYLDSV